MADVSLDAVGAVELTGVAAITQQTLMVATGTVSLSGPAWLSPRFRGQDTLLATGTIKVGHSQRRRPAYYGPSAAPVRLTTDETFPATSGGWVTPTVTAPDIREDA